MTPPPNPLSYQTPGARNSGLAIASMVCGLIALMGIFTNVCCLIFLLPVAAICAIVSLALGFTALSQIRRSAGSLVGRGFALTGIICSIIFLALESALAIVVVILVMKTPTAPAIPSVAPSSPPASLPATTSATAPVE